MNPALETVLYLVVLCSAFAAWQSGRGDAPGPGRRPVATLVALAVIGVPSLLQLTVAPQLLGALGRDTAATWTGQPWRVVTALVVQDGGWAGTAFNLVALLWIGAAAESAWGSRRWVGVALCSGIGAQAWGWLVQPAGAGNSVVVFGLAASLLVWALRARPAAARIASAVGLLAAAGLLVGGDLHGGAAAIGALVAVVLITFPFPARRGGDAGPRPPR